MKNIRDIPLPQLGLQCYSLQNATTLSCQENSWQSYLTEEASLTTDESIVECLVCVWSIYVHTYIQMQVYVHIGIYVYMYIWIYVVVGIVYDIGTSGVSGSWARVSILSTFTRWENWLPTCRKTYKAQHAQVLKALESAVDSGFGMLSPMFMQQQW